MPLSATPVAPKSTIDDRCNVAIVLACLKKPGAYRAEVCESMRKTKVALRHNISRKPIRAVIQRWFRCHCGHRQNLRHELMSPQGEQQRSFGGWAWLRLRGIHSSGKCKLRSHLQGPKALPQRSKLRFQCPIQASRRRRETAGRCEGQEPPNLDALSAQSCCQPLGPHQRSNSDPGTHGVMRGEHVARQGRCDGRLPLTKAPPLCSAGSCKSDQKPECVLHVSIDVREGKLVDTDERPTSSRRLAAELSEGARGFLPPLPPLISAVDCDRPI
jgi:hypothetical protein